MSSRNQIQVVCRLRPENQLELSGHYARCTTFNDKSIKIKVGVQSNKDGVDVDFHFDRIFGPDISQQSVFETVAQPMVNSIFEGYNGTILAYGQTGSGKTYAMEGPQDPSPENMGIMPRMMNYLFNRIQSEPDELEFTVKCSMLEIYKEKINDLLDPRKTNLMIKDDKIRGIFVQNATEVYVGNAEEMLEVMRGGANNRSVAATRMNERSSRSHSMFILTLNAKNIVNDGAKKGKLYFVDLAGSEKIGKTEVTGKELEEAKKINQSLSELGNVINALTSKKAASFINYRNSKLTRLLQESLGGNSLTSLIITCSMSAYNDAETLSTCRFGSRAKQIQNKAVMNVEKSTKQLQAELRVSQTKIDKLKEIAHTLYLKIRGSIKGMVSAEESVRILREEFEDLILRNFDDIEGLHSRFVSSELLAEIVQEDACEDDIDIDKDITPTDSMGLERKISNLLDKQQLLRGEHSLSSIIEEEGFEGASIVADISSELTTSMITALEEGKDLRSLLEKGEGDSLSSFVTPVSTLLGPRAVSKTAASRLLKMQIELSNVSQELAKEAREKRDLEDEITLRNKELYDVNDKLMITELKMKWALAENLRAMNEMHVRVEGSLFNNQQRNNDLKNLHKCLDRLKSDVELTQIARTSTQSLDSNYPPLGLTDSIEETLKVVLKLEKSFGDETEHLLAAQIFHGNERVRTDETLVSTNFTEDEGKFTIYTEPDPPDSPRSSQSTLEMFKSPNREREEIKEQVRSTENEILEKMKEMQDLTSRQRDHIHSLTIENEELKYKVNDLETGIKHENVDYYNSLQDELSQANNKTQNLQLQLADLVLTYDKEKAQGMADLKNREEMIEEKHNKWIVEKDRLDKVLKLNPEKKKMFALENKLQELIVDKQTYFTQIGTLRQKLDQRDQELKKLYQKISKLEREILTQHSVSRMKKEDPNQPALMFLQRNEKKGGVRFKRFDDLIGERFSLNNMHDIRRRGAGGKHRQRVGQGQGPPTFFSNKVIKPLRGGGGVTALTGGIFTDTPNQTPLPKCKISKITGEDIDSQGLPHKLLFNNGYNNNGSQGAGSQRGSQEMGERDVSGRGGSHKDVAGNIQKFDNIISERPIGNNRYRKGKGGHQCSKFVPGEEITEMEVRKQIFEEVLQTNEELDRGESSEEEEEEDMGGPDYGNPFKKQKQQSPSRNREGDDVGVGMRFNKGVAKTINLLGGIKY